MKYLVTYSFATLNGTFRNSFTIDANEKDITENLLDFILAKTKVHAYSQTITPLYDMVAIEEFVASKE